MEKKFIENGYYGINGVTEEDTINQESFNYDNNVLIILVTEEENNNSTNCFNIYIIDEKFKKCPTNCLFLQEPKEDLINHSNFNESKPKEYFNKLYMEKVAIGHYLWDKYSNSEEPKEFGVTEY